MDGGYKKRMADQTDSYYFVQMDRTCVAGDGNWKTLQQTFDPETNKTLFTCKAGVTCRNYSEV